MRLPFNRPIPPVSSAMGWRIHPIEKTRKHHNGVDWAASIGTPVYAIASGKVIYAGPSTIKLANGEPGGGGYIVRVRHRVNREWITATYMHLKKGSIPAAGIKKGDTVAEGQKVGETGNTGASTGPHLHFEIQRGKNYVYTTNGTRYLEPISYIKTQIAMEAKK